MDKMRAIGALGALAQITRLEAFQALIKSEPQGIAAGELARLLGVAQNTLSAHLSILARADLVSAERRSRSIIYRAKISVFQEVTLFLLQDCCDGRAEVCAAVIKGLSPCRPTGKAKARRPIRPSSGVGTTA